MGENVASAAIQSGPVEQVGQKKYKFEFARDAAFQFFGFKTTNDNTSGVTKITETTVVTYETALFKTTKDTLATIDATILKTELAIQAA